jgi:hypothetical protein
MERILMADQPVRFEITAVVPGETTLDRMKFLIETIRQTLEAENVRVQDVDWYDRESGE